MAFTAQKTEFQHQNYGLFWPAVYLSERAKSRFGELDILYDGFSVAFSRTVLQVLQSVIADQNKQNLGIGVVEISSDVRIPAGIKMSYSFGNDGLMICDLWTPPQPALFA